MIIDLAGKVAVVTGSSRGIGRACAEALGASGAHVVVNYYSHADEAQAAVETIQRHGAEAVAVQADVATREGCARLVDTAVERFGRLDIAVANAYRSVRKPAVELSPADVAVTWDATLWHTFHLAQLAARVMQRQGEGGRLLFISSVHAFCAYPTAMPYNVAKAGLNHMARSLAGELAGDGILCNSIEPGWINTPGELQFSTEEELREAGRSVPVGRLGRPDEVADLVVFLASDRAAYITGSVLRIDGGFVLPRTI